MNSELQNPLIQDSIELSAESYTSWLGEDSVVVLIINFYAGTLAQGNGVTEILDEMTKLGARLEVYRSRAIGDAKILAAKHGLRADLIVCAGGDGTLNEVVSGLMTLKNPPPLGYIAAGTTCDFARTLHLPIADYRAAAKILSEGAPVPLDIGRMNDLHFVYVASFGAFTTVASDTSHKMKKAWGHLAYLIEGLRSLPSIKPIRVEVEMDDETIDDELIFGAVTNSTSIGGLLRIAERNVLMDDGKFEVLLIRSPQNPLDAANLVSALINQDFTNKHIHFFSTNKLKLRLPEAIRWTIDGEDAGAQEEVSIENIKQALKIVIPVSEAELGESH